MMKSTFGQHRRWCGVLGGAVFLSALTGCGSSQWLVNGFIDPTQVGNFNKTRRNEIRPTLGLLEEQKGIQNAVDPTDTDLQPDFSEKTIGPGDTIEIAIFELTTPGGTELLRFTIGNSGFETIPQLGPVKLTGLTSRELELDLKDRLREAQVLRDADVRVALLQSMGQRFVALGFLQNPGAFPIPRPDFRLLEAVAMIGGISDQVDKIYIGTRSPAGTVASDPNATPVSYTLSDYSQGTAGSTTAPATRPSAINESDILDGGPTGPPRIPQWDAEKQEWVEGPVTAPATNAPQTPARTSTADGAMMPLQDAGGAPMSSPTAAPLMPPASPTPTQAPAFASPPIPATQSIVPPGERGPFEPGMRVIEIPMKDLLAFDGRYNIIIRPNDVVYVPQVELGEYFMMGHVARPGAYRFSGRPLTVKEAIASAGGFDALAWPSRADLVRRLSQYEEQIVQLDLDAIFAGSAPDFYMRPNDILNVGTHAVATFLAVARNAFRLSYGFGFVYDRNFADEDSFFAQEQIRARRRSERQQLGLPILR